MKKPPITIEALYQTLKPILANYSSEELKRFYDMTLSEDIQEEVRRYAKF